MADRAERQYDRRPKCPCGRDLRTRQEQQIGECRKCQDENGGADDPMDVEYSHNMEMRSDG